MTITDNDLEQARTAWGEALLAISSAYETGGIEAARTLAGEVLDATYNYAEAPVLFKPTLASGDQTFRPTRAGALSYFVAHDPDFPRDNGFAIMGWVTVEFETAATFIHGDTAMWMGSARFTNKDGSITIADKSWGYKKDSAGDLRIVHHHSSLPYQP